MSELKKIETLDREPFKNMVATIGNLPTSFVDSMSYFDMLAWLCNYIQDTLIPAVNDCGEAVEELQAKYEELKAYVDNYFENLDVQEEINNKLDDMAESGELTSLITQYLELGALLCYNTKSDLKSAENMAEGSFAKTFGTTTYNDGEGHFYKIRALLNTDVIDDDNLLALANYPTLVAEKMPDAEIEAISTRIDGVDDRIDDIEDELALGKNEKVILVGDSYALNTSNYCGWADPLQTLLGLTNANCKIVRDNGGGFARIGDNGTFLTALTTASESYTNKDKFTKIIVCGGINDCSLEKSEIDNGIQAFISYCKTTFPNAEIFVGHISGRKDDTSDGQLARFRMYQRSLPCYKDSVKYGAKYLNGVEYVMKNYRDYYNTSAGNHSHPNDDGSNALAQAIYEAVYNGKCYVYYHQSDITDDSSTLSAAVDINLYFVDDKLNIICHEPYYCTFSFASSIASFTGTASLGHFALAFYRNVFPNVFSIPVTGILVAASNVNFTGELHIDNGTMTLRTDYNGTLANVSAIRIRPFLQTIDGNLC